MTTDRKVNIGFMCIFLGFCIFFLCSCSGIETTDADSIFDAPSPYHTSPVQYLQSSRTDVISCVIVYDGVAWLMAQNRNKCDGWIPL